MANRDVDLNSSGSRKKPRISFPEPSDDLPQFETVAEAKAALVSGAITEQDFTLAVAELQNPGIFEGGPPEENKWSKHVNDNPFTEQQLEKIKLRETLDQFKAGILIIPGFGLATRLKDLRHADIDADAFDMRDFAKQERGSTFRLRLEGAWKEFARTKDIEGYSDEYNAICDVENTGSTFVDDLRNEVLSFIAPIPRNNTTLGKLMSWGKRQLRL